jgi:hypothetical protein
MGQLGKAGLEALAEEGLRPEVRAEKRCGDEDKDGDME